MEWVSINDKSPKISHDKFLYKIMLFAPSTLGITTGYYWGNTESQMKGFCTMGVTHWAALPQPPKE